jgi:uncharacterized protein with PQ loop repeat
MAEALHHFHRRKRIHQKHEPYPHPNKWKRFMDKAIYFVGAFGLIMTIPQLTKIWIGKNATGVSIISWSAYLITATFWLFYGIMHREKPIIFIYSGWILLEFAIILGIILYG